MVLKKGMVYDMENKNIKLRGRVIDFSEQLDYKLMNDYIDALAERYLFLSVTSIGQTVLGRRIPMISIGRGKKTVLYVGAQSGTEFQSAAVLLRFVNELCEYVANDGRFYNCSAAYMLATRTVIVIPMLNPDGVEYCLHGIDEDNPMYSKLVGMGIDLHSWNRNARGVSLYENFGERFEDSVCLEPETGALRNYLMFNRDIRLAILLRMGNNRIVCSHERTTPPKLNSIGNGIARLSNCEYERIGVSGTLCNFCAQELVIPAFEMLSTYSESGSCFGDYLRQRSALFLAPTMI